MKKSFALLAVLILLTGCGSTKEQFSNERAYRPAIDIEFANSYDDILDDPIATDSAPNEKIYQMVSDVYFYINDVRAAKNLKPLVWDQKLSERAKIRSEEAAVKFDNLTRPNGEIWYTIAPYDALAESICKTKKVDMSTIKSWMTNKEDKENFICTEYTKIGLGVCLNDKGEYTLAVLFGSDTIVQ